MGQQRRRPEETGDPAGDAWRLDLDERACPTCRRDLPPWEAECPDCREPAVLRFALPPAVPAPPAHLLDDEPRAGDPSAAGEADAHGAELIARALAETREETREPTDDVDGPPQPPPVAGDPHFG